MLPGVVSIFASPTFPEAECHGPWHGGLNAGTKHAVEQSSPSDPRYDRRPTSDREKPVDVGGFFGGSLVDVG